MPYVVTQSCCADASCVVACPVNCIHPTPDEPDFGSAEMLYVDPRACVDCGACTTACPVDAIKPHTALTEAELPFIALNSDWFAQRPDLDRPILAPVKAPRWLPGDPVRVAVVGAGPAGLYTADELLRHLGVTVDVYDRLTRPYGLARYGVAPDHPSTRKVAGLFEKIEQQPGFAYRLGVEVGVDISHEDLARHYHAVVYTVGASADRSLGIPGEELPGSEPATEIVGWYNGHPDHQNAYVDLGAERIVVVGNGNVALDLARILTSEPDRLVDTSIDPLALACLRGSRLKEIVLLGRRGPAEAAFTVPELVGLAGLTDVDVLVDSGGEAILADSPKTALLAELAAREPTPGRRQIVLRFRTAPVRILGDEERGVTGIEVARTELVRDDTGVLRARLTAGTEMLPAGMVIRSVGYRGRPVTGLPFDEASGTVPNQAGRVAPGVYVAGWIKRGPTGFIGTNKSCAEETVASLLDDLVAGALPEPAETVDDLERWRGTDRRARFWPRVRPWPGATRKTVATVGVPAGSSTTRTAVS